MLGGQKAKRKLIIKSIKNIEIVIHTIYHKKDVTNQLSWSKLEQAEGKGTTLGNIISILLCNLRFPVQFPKDVAEKDILPRIDILPNGQIAEISVTWEEINSLKLFAQYSTALVFVVTHIYLHTTLLYLKLVFF